MPCKPGLAPERAVRRGPDPVCSSSCSTHPLLTIPPPHPSPPLPLAQDDTGDLISAAAAAAVQQQQEAAGGQQQQQQQQQQGFGPDMGPAFQQGSTAAAAAAAAWQLEGDADSQETEGGLPEGVVLVGAGMRMTGQCTKRFIVFTNAILFIFFTFESDFF